MFGVIKGNKILGLYSEKPEEDSIEYDRIIEIKNYKENSDYILNGEDIILKNKEIKEQKKIEILQIASLEDQINSLAEVVERLTRTSTDSFILEFRAKFDKIKTIRDR